jgi:hypothetical protein
VFGEKICCLSLLSRRRSRKRRRGKGIKGRFADEKSLSMLNSYFLLLKKILNLDSTTVTF